MCNAPGARPSTSSSPPSSSSSSSSSSRSAPPLSIDYWRSITSNPWRSVRRRCEFLLGFDFSFFFFEIIVFFLFGGGGCFLAEKKTASSRFFVCFFFVFVLFSTFAFHFFFRPPRSFPPWNTVAGRSNRGHPADMIGRIHHRNRIHFIIELLGSSSGRHVARINVANGEWLKTGIVVNSRFFFNGTQKRAPIGSPIIQ